MKKHIVAVLFFSSLIFSGCAQQNYNRVALSAINSAIYGATYNSRSIPEEALNGALRAIDCYPLHALCNPDLYK